MKVRLKAPEGKMLRHVPTGSIYSEVICDEKKQTQYIVADSGEDPAVEIIDGETVEDRIGRAFAYSEDSMRATRNYSVGMYIAVSSHIYEVTAAIANGVKITPGINVAETTIGEQLSAIFAALNN